MATTAEPIEQIKQRIELIPLEARRRRSPPATALIDVREQHEWDEAHLEAAEPHPPGRAARARSTRSPPTAPSASLLYCRTDNRSARAADALAELGYENVAVIERRDRRLGGRRAAAVVASPG